MAFFKELQNTVISEVDDYETSAYANIIPTQMKLYSVLGDNVTEEWLAKYMANI